MKIYVVNTTPEIPVGSITWRGFAGNVEVPAGLSWLWRGFRMTPVIAIGKITSLRPYGFGWRVNGRDMEKIAEDLFIATETDLLPLSPGQIWREREHLLLAGVATKEFLSALDFHISEWRGGLAPDEWGHGYCYREIKMMGKTAHLYFTECRGPGYSCSYDHPRGIKIVPGDHRKEV